MPICNYCGEPGYEGLCDDCEELYDECEEDPRDVERTAIRNNIIKLNKQIAEQQSLIDNKVKGKVRDAKALIKQLNLQVRFQQERLIRPTATIYDVM